MLDRCWQQATGPPEKSIQYRGPGTGDLEEDAQRERRVVRMKWTQLYARDEEWNFDEPSLAVPVGTNCN